MRILRVQHTVLTGGEVQSVGRIGRDCHWRIIVFDEAIAKDVAKVLSSVIELNVL